jgi:2-methylcitrate dehydratase PrpD
MTVARELAEFLTRTSSSDLPRQAVDHAAMLIASTIASAAMSAGLESYEIIRTLARERGGSARSTTRTVVHRRRRALSSRPPSFD